MYLYAIALESGIDISPGINAAPLFRILIHFFVNHGIAVMFQIFFLKIFQKQISIPLLLFQTLKYLS